MEGGFVPSLILAIAFGLVFMADAAMAGNILITDVGEGPPGVAAQGGAVIAGLACIAEACAFTIIAPAGTAGTIPVGICPVCGGTGPANINLFEDATFTELSDTLKFDGLMGQNTTWVFLSDGGPLTLIALAPSSDIVEDGTAQTVVRINYINAAGVISTDTIQIQSDAEIPEPSPWAMVLGGVFAFSYARVIRSRTTLRKN
jgi:hypothetical protein